MKLGRIIYLGYDFKKADFQKLARFRRYVTENHQLSPTAQWKDLISSALKYNVSFDDYYLFRFYEKDATERQKWAGTGTMYEYQKIMNPPQHRPTLVHKPSFHKMYSRFIRHRMYERKELEQDLRKAEELLQSPSGKVVLKPADGQCGRGIEILDSGTLTPASLMARMKASGNEVAEEYVVQHDQLNRLSPTGLNTVRIITQLDNHDEVHILGARLRISVNSMVDNLAAGNLVAGIDLETGIVNTPAVYSDITKPEVTVHPVTHQRITGFEIPYWSQSLDMVKDAARMWSL